MGTLVQVATCRKRYRAGDWESITARSGLTNPLHKIPSTLRDRIPNTVAQQYSPNLPGTLRYSPGVYRLDMSIQVLDSRRSRSRASLTASNLDDYKIVGEYIQDKKRCGFLLILREDERSIAKIRLGQIH